MVTSVLLQWFGYVKLLKYDFLYLYICLFIFSVFIWSPVCLFIYLLAIYYTYVCGDTP